MASSGITSEQALELIQAEPVARFDAALVAVGGNDVTEGISPARWVERLHRLTGALHTRFDVAH